MFEIKSKPKLFLYAAFIDVNDIEITLSTITMKRRRNYPFLLRTISDLLRLLRGCIHLRLIRIVIVAGLRRHLRLLVHSVHLRLRPLIRLLLLLLLLLLHIYTNGLHIWIGRTHTPSGRAHSWHVHPHRHVRVHIWIHAVRVHRCALRHRSRSVVHRVLSVRGPSGLLLLKRIHRCLHRIVAAWEILGLQVSTRCLCIAIHFSVNVAQTLIEDRRPFQNGYLQNF